MSKFKEEFAHEILQMSQAISRVFGCMEYIEEYSYVGYYEDNQQFIRDALNSVSNKLSFVENRLDSVCNIIKEQFEY